MSEMAKKARSDMRAKIKRLMVDPKGKIDASDWTPPEPLEAGRKVYDKAKERSATTKIYKHGGRIQGDRGPVNRGKKARGHRADGGVPASRFSEDPVVTHSGLMNRGGRTGCDHMAKGGKTRTGNRGGDGYYEGTRPTGGRIARARGGPSYSKDAVDKEIRKDPRIKPKEAANIHRLLRGRVDPADADIRRTMTSRKSLFDEDDPTMKSGGRAKRAMGGSTMPSGAVKQEDRAPRAMGGRTKGRGKATNIVINVGEKQPPMPMPPIQAPTRPPMPPPGPPPGMAGPPPGMPPGGPPGGPGGPPIPPPSMMGRKRGGRTLSPKQGVDVHMRAGAGGGLGRLEKIKQYGARHSS